MNLEQKTLFVGGTFNGQGGKTSLIAHQVFNEVKTERTEYHNGGYFEELETIISNIEDYGLVYWFPNIPNDKDKLVKEIKRKNKKCVLVTSKRNTENKYSFADIVSHALGNKSNLFVEIRKANEYYEGRVADPLGNVFLINDVDFRMVGKFLKYRTEDLLKYTRVSSHCIGKKKEVPNEKGFFAVARAYGTEFHRLVHANEESKNRFFGNVSFRCENGFPSFKKGRTIYVSKRNIDKRGINKDGFVAVKQALPVQYYGEEKPSVDTPIQVKLYEHYPNVRYMLHGHVYIKGAPYTREVIPCGALEEVDAITKLFPDRERVNFSVNLSGHGSIVLVDSVQKLGFLDYYSRETPEFQPNYVHKIIDEREAKQNERK
jgi:hypothetical protein